MVRMGTVDEKKRQRQKASGERTKRKLPRADWRRWKHWRLVREAVWEEETRLGSVAVSDSVD